MNLITKRCNVTDKTMFCKVLNLYWVKKWVKYRLYDLWKPEKLIQVKVIFNREKKMLHIIILIQKKRVYTIWIHFFYHVFINDFFHK